MFAKLRRKPRPAAAPAQPPTPPAPAAPELDVADAGTVARAERLRHALQEAGANLAALAPEPAWFAEARAGHTVKIGADERAELIAHLGSTTTTSVTSDEECDQSLARLEAFTVLREMHSEGMNVRTCDGAPLSAAALRAIRDAVHEAERTHAERQAGDLPGAA
ncbi:hypothetical protein [Streptomyces sp. NPDC058084]|uniref:hypothetical protein n=1 Tax=Streptomyces sp. NPDC058084 TaxID=3346333 RepID=UPI0036E27798